jgi:hypothetical protein
MAFFHKGPREVDVDGCLQIFPGPVSQISRGENSQAKIGGSGNFCYNLEGN